VLFVYKETLKIILLHNVHKVEMESLFSDFVCCTFIATSSRLLVQAYSNLPYPVLCIVLLKMVSV